MTGACAGKVTPASISSPVRPGPTAVENTIAVVVIARTAPRWRVP